MILLETEFKHIGNWYWMWRRLSETEFDCVGDYRRPSLILLVTEFAGIEDRVWLYRRKGSIISEIDFDYIVDIFSETDFNRSVLSETDFDYTGDRVWLYRRQSLIISEIVKLQTTSDFSVQKNYVNCFLKSMLC